MLEKCVLTILELNWNQRFGHKITKLNICHQMLTYVVHTTTKQVISRRRKNENVYKMSKNEKAPFFIDKYAYLWGFCCRRRRGCLMKLPIIINSKSFTPYIVTSTALLPVHLINLQRALSTMEGVRKKQ